MTDNEAIFKGFDALVEFIPTNDNNAPRKLSNLPRFFINRILNRFIEFFKIEKFINKLPVTSVYDYDKYADLKIKHKPQFKTFPCSIPNWDNSARKRISVTFQNDDPDKFKHWIKKSIEKSKNILGR